ncbi:hypothetical protein THRCLA_04738 [Thraustotheca clavata]|uniref:JmjC domain-containing protein n=1 Tax=Thraustotheca clavata TaxID=74557 RepID=A0A1V9ZY96_9STRA|nr:hypothetical protein THRCLA_04738 [Thraustotheca clavata]
MSIVRCVFCQKEKRMPSIGIVLSAQDVTSVRFCCQPSCFKAYHSRGTFVDIRHRELVPALVIYQDIEKQRLAMQNKASPRVSTPPQPSKASIPPIQPGYRQPERMYTESGPFSKRQKLEGPRMPNTSSSLPSLNVNSGYTSRTSPASSIALQEDNVSETVSGTLLDDSLPLWRQPSYVASLERFRRNLPIDDEMTYRIDLTKVYATQGRIDEAEIDFIFRCLEGTTTVMVVKGFIAEFSADIWTVTNFLDSVPGNLHWSFNKYKAYSPNERQMMSTQNSLYYTGDICITMTEFRKYIFATQRNTSAVVNVVDINNKHWPIGVEEVLSLNGLDLELYCGEMYTDLMERFSWKSILPGGRDCLLQYVPKPYRDGRFSPKLHCSFVGDRSELLNAGNGSTDVIYQVIHGELEFIIFDQYPSVAYNRVFDFLKRMGYQPNHRGEIYEKYLYNLKKFGYVSHKVRVQPGECVHINRGRLHMWRSVDDKVDAGPRGFSMFISWEWIYQGVTIAGIADSARYSFQKAQLSIVNSTESRLPPYVFDPRLYIIEAVRRHVSSMRSTPVNLRRAAQTKLRLAALREVFYAMLQEEQRLQSDGDDSWFVRDSHGGNHLRNIVDHGFSPESYRCSVCRNELSNSYKQCLGCAIFSAKPMPISFPHFNMCMSCYYQDADHHLTYHSRSGARSCHGHTGSLVNTKRFKEAPESVECSCPNAKSCPICDGCDSCCCICHTMFQTRYRSQRPDELVQLYGAMSAITQAGNSNVLQPKRVSLWDAHMAEKYKMHRNNACLNLAGLVRLEDDSKPEKTDSMDFDIWRQILDEDTTLHSKAIPIASVPRPERRESAMETLEREFEEYKPKRAHTI